MMQSPCMIVHGFRGGLDLSIEGDAFRGLLLILFHFFLHDDGTINTDYTPMFDMATVWLVLNTFIGSVYLWL